MDIDKTNIGNLTDGFALDTVVPEGSMEMDDDGDCRRAYQADDMDANDGQTSRQVQMVNNDSAIPCQHDKTEEAGVQSPPVEVEVSLCNKQSLGKEKGGKPRSVRQACHWLAHNTAPTP